MDDPEQNPSTPNALVAQADEPVHTDAEALLERTLPRVLQALLPQMVETIARRLELGIIQISAEGNVVVGGDLVGRDAITMLSAAPAFLRVGDRAINLSLVSSVERDTSAGDTIVIRFASASSPDAENIVLKGKEAREFWKWLRRHGRGRSL